jgi:hypothetical protein
VSLDTVLGLVEHGTDGEVPLEGAECGLGVVELHVHAPQLGLVLADEVGAEQVGALGVAGRRPRCDAGKGALAVFLLQAKLRLAPSPSTWKL